MRSSGARLCSIISGLLLVSVIHAGSPSSSFATSDPADDVARAERVTVVDASRPASTLIKLPRPVTMLTPFDNTPSLSIEGSDELTLVVLEPVNSSNKAPILIGGQLPKGAPQSEFLMPINAFNYDFAKFYDDEVRLPAGTYRIYVLPQAGPASVTLRFPELEGSTRLDASTPARAQFRFPMPRLQGGNGASNNIYSGGDQATLRNDGLIFHVLWLLTSAHLAGQYQFCIYENPQALMEPIAFGPGCPPDGHVGLANDRLVNLEEDDKVLFEGYSVPESSYAQGVWMTTQSIVEELGYAALWLDLSD